MQTRIRDISTQPLLCASQMSEQVRQTPTEDMDDVWSWISTLPAPTGDVWPSADSPPSLQLAAASGKSILLTSERTSQALVTFSLLLQGFHPSNPTKTLWLSDPFPLPSPHIPLLLHLLQELTTSFGDPPLPKLNLPEEQAEQLTSCPQTPSLLSLSLLCRLFWLCACDAPAEAGFLFFTALGPSISHSLDCKDALRRFLVSAGPDREERLMRSLGYMLAKWYIIRELQGGDAAPAAALSYAAEVHGLWVLKGYAPIAAMSRVGHRSDPETSNGAKESVLRYTLAHQQLQSLVQLEYSVSMRDPRYIRIGVRVDNIRLHVKRLGFGHASDHDEDGMEAERHFPSRVRVWVGPEAGAAYAAGPSLGRSTGNPERTVDVTRIVKGSFGSGKGVPTTSPVAVKAKSRSLARIRARSWRWEQEAEGSAGVFEGVLCDGGTGAEVAGGRPGDGVGGDGMRRRCKGNERALSKEGGLVAAADELPEEMNWRVGKEMEGRAVRWRIGVRVWASYFPSEVKSGYFETRCMEWREEVELPLVAAGYLN